MAKPERVLIIYSWFKEYMSSRGMKISFPSTSDYTKTYMYRWLNRFTDLVRSAGFDDNTIKEYLKIIVEYIKDNKLSRQGASVLNNNKVLESCYKELLARNNNVEKICQDLVRCKNFMDQYDNSRNVLLKCDKIGSYPNIIKWYKDNVLTLQYIVLSKICMSVFDHMDDVDRDELPKDTELLKMRIRLFDRCSENRLKEIMGDDLAKWGIVS